MTLTTNHPNNSKAATLKDIADECGLSVATVSRALRDPNRHSEETTRRIMAVAEALGYNPAHHQGARRLVLSRFGKEVVNHLFALIFPPFFYKANYFTEVFQGLLDVLTPAGYGLLTVDSNQSSEHGLPPSFCRGDVDAVIVAADPKDYPAILDQLRGQPAFGNRPIVTLMTPADGCATVLLDAQGGGYAAASHLLELGHRHLLHFCGPYEDTHQALHEQRNDTLRGYQQAYRDHGLDPDQHLHYVRLDSRLWKLAFRAANHPKLAAFPSTASLEQHPLLELLRKRPEITGILALNDPTALIIHHMLRRAGFRVPDDISLVGFDDTDQLLDEHGENILTTVRSPLRQVGRKAARLLISQVNGQKVKERMITLPTALQIRGTTAPPHTRTA